MSFLRSPLFRRHKIKMKNLGILTRLFFLTSATLGVVLSFQNCGKQMTPKIKNTEFNSVDNEYLFSPGLRRLSISELDALLQQSFNDNTRPAQRFLPSDARVPFDNDVKFQTPSIPLIEGLEQMSMDVAQRFLANSTNRNEILGCTPLHSADNQCMKIAIQRLTQRLFRKIIEESMVDRLVNHALAQATKENNFYEGVDIAIRSMIQHPLFIYRFEAGSMNNDGNYQLDANELASRLSFLIWGSGPDEQLIRMAHAGHLQSREQIRAEAIRLLSDPKAVMQTKRFHALWLAYEKLPHSPSLSNAMREEADEIVQKVIFDEDRPWSYLLTFEQTKITDPLKDIYGFTNINTSTWIQLPADRRGLLSTAAFLSVAPKFGDTSPTQRGKFIRERILCQTIPPPPPTTDVDSPPPDVGGNNCKVSRYEKHRQQGSSCFACHERMDPIGFGLENYDRLGRFRQFDNLPDGKPNNSCSIEGTGSIAELGTFKGPRELSELLLRSEKIEPCMIQQLYHFAFGETATPQKYPLINRLQLEFKKSGGKYKELILSLVTADEFRSR